VRLFRQNTETRHSQGISVELIQYLHDDSETEVKQQKSSHLAIESLLSSPVGPRVSPIRATVSTSTARLFTSRLT